MSDDKPGLVFRLILDDGKLKCIHFRDVPEYRHWCPSCNQEHEKKRMEKFNEAKARRP